jgi:uncharacterized protein
MIFKISKRKKFYCYVLFITCLPQVWAQVDSANFKRFFYENGQVSSEGFMKNGAPDGYWVSYHRNGQKKTEGNRVNNELDGVWNFYNEDGQISVSISYKDGKKQGPRITFLNNVRIKEELFDADKREGFTAHYYDSGELFKEVPFENDKENGLGYEYGMDGTIITLNTFKSGVQVKQQKINRTDAAGLRQGFWMFFHPNKQSKEEGLYVNNLKHGYWKYFMTNGNLIRTEKWIMGVLQEDSKEIAKVDVRRSIDPKTGRIAAIGAYLEGKKEGVHRQYDANGNVIGSQIYKADRLLAEGIYDEQGRKQDLWKYYFENGTLKETGSYKDNLKVGAWKYLFMDGKVEQNGSYVAGKPNGDWMWFYPDGSIRKEMTYENGEADGTSVEYDEQGNIVAKGDFVDDLKEGKWVYRYGDVVEDVVYFEGEPNGLWTKKDLITGQLLFEGTYAAGQENGKFVWYHENGIIYRRGSFVMGVREGIWETFTPFGTVDFTIEYQNGKEIRYNGEKITYGKRVDRALEAEKQND